MKAQLLFICAFKTAILSSHHVRVVGAQDGGEEEADGDSCRTCATCTNNASSPSSGPNDESIVLDGDGDNIVTSDELPGNEKKSKDAGVGNAASAGPYVYPPPVSHSNYNQHNDGDELSAPSLFIRPITRLQDVSVEEFDEEYSPAEKAVPLVLFDLMPSTFDPADWTREAIMEECCNIPLIDPDDLGCTENLTRAVVDEDCHQVRYVNSSLFGKEWAGLAVANLAELNVTTLGDLLELQDKPEGQHLYLHDAPMSHICPTAVDRIRVPKYFPFDYRMLENDPDTVEDMTLEHFPDIFISKKGTGSPLHCDSDMTRFYFQLLSGKKLWRVMPPSEYWRASPTDADDYYPSKFEVNLMNVDFDQFPDMNGALVFEAILSPGDVIFVPEGWAHQIINLEDSIATSMNFVDYHGAPAHIRNLLFEKGPKAERSYFYRMITSFLTPLDTPDRDLEEGEDGNYAVDDWLQHHHFYLLDVPMAVEEFVEYRTRLRNGLNSYRTSDGFTALHVAVMSNYEAVVEHLLENGASLLERDYMGRTAKDVAIKLDHYEIVEMLDWHRRDRGTRSFRSWIDWYLDALY